MCYVQKKLPFLLITMLLLMLIGVPEPALSEGLEVSGVFPDRQQDACLWGEELSIPLDYLADLDLDAVISYRWIITNKFGREEEVPFQPLEGRPDHLAIRPEHGTSLRLEVKTEQHGQTHVETTDAIYLSLPHTLEIPDKVPFNKPFTVRLRVDYPHGKIVSFDLDADLITEVIKKVKSPGKGWKLKNINGDWSRIQGKSKTPYQTLTLDFTMVLTGEGALFLDGLVYDEDGGQANINLIYGLPPQAQEE